MNLSDISQNFQVSLEQAEAAREVASLLVGRSLPSEELTREEATCISMILTTLKLALPVRPVEQMAYDMRLPAAVLKKAKQYFVAEPAEVAIAA